MDVVLKRTVQGRTEPRGARTALLRSDGWFRSTKAATNQSHDPRYRTHVRTVAVPVWIRERWHRRCPSVDPSSRPPRGRTIRRDVPDDRRTCSATVRSTARLLRSLSLCRRAPIVVVCALRSDKERTNRIAATEVRHVVLLLLRNEHAPFASTSFEVRPLREMSKDGAKRNQPRIRLFLRIEPVSSGSSFPF